MKRIPVGILGATGMVGQRFATLLADHPWSEVVALAASPRSRGKTYEQAVDGRWTMPSPIPPQLKRMTVQAVETDMERITQQAQVVFSALDMDKRVIQTIEADYAGLGVAVISNNSAHRWTDDVPMIIPEVNPDHVKLIDAQRKNRGWGTGLIAVKPNCSIQSYVTILSALQQFHPTDISVTSLQAISGAGKTFETWPEMVDNVIPFISGEEEKSEREPLKIWGDLRGGSIRLATTPSISATCIRVPVSNGHLANVSARFVKKPSQAQILKAIASYVNPIDELHLPSAPQRLIHYFEAEDRPQIKLDRDYKNGMGITMGRLRPDKHFDWQFVALSHNTLRGAAGGAVLMAELLVAKSYIPR